MAERAYHHGDLRESLLEHAEQAILESGPGHLSLRDLARRAGVSHAAPAYHFGDKRGLLGAFAAEGFRLLADRLNTALEETGLFVDVAVAYVEFAIEHRAQVEVMFRTDLYDPAGAEVSEARALATAVLDRGLGTLPAQSRSAGLEVAKTAAWSLVHGFASLWLGGALDIKAEDVPDTVRAIGLLLFSPEPSEPDPLGGRRG